jgi:hypothetical protein
MDTRLNCMTRFHALLKRKGACSADCHPLDSTYFLRFAESSDNTRLDQLVAGEPTFFLTRLARRAEKRAYWPKDANVRRSIKAVRRRGTTVVAVRSLRASR